MCRLGANAVDQTITAITAAAAASADGQTSEKSSLLAEQYEYAYVGQ